MTICLRSLATTLSIKASTTARRSQHIDFQHVVPRGEIGMPERLVRGPNTPALQIRRSIGRPFVAAVSRAIEARSPWSAT